MLTEKNNLEYFVAEFRSMLNIEWAPVGSLRKEAEEFIKYLVSTTNIKPHYSKNALIKSINSKFELHKELIKEFYRYHAIRGYTFNYHEKAEIREFINTDNIKGLKSFLEVDCAIPSDFFNNPTIRLLSKKETINSFKVSYQEEHKKDDICSSLFSAYIFNLCEPQIAHNYFTNFEIEDKKYYEDFYEHLLNHESHLLHRQDGLRILKIDETLLSEFDDYRHLQEVIFKYIDDSFKKLSNHSYLAIHVKLPDSNVLNINRWELLSDIQIFAEKYIERPLKIGYFHPKKIKEQTQKHIPLNEIDFDKINEGFTYKDNFILSYDKKEAFKDKISYKHYDTLLLLEKNERDERTVPCPACRSKKVRGNSYPTIGVKSWECYNQLCPEKSKYNRGKRYSLASLIRQEAIDNEQNLISPESVKEWRLDVSDITSDKQIIKFLICHYSLVKDTIVLTNYNIQDALIFNRHVSIYPISSVKDRKTNIDFLKNGDFFKRIYSEKFNHKKVVLKNISPIEGVEIYNGDSVDILTQFSKNTFDGAVTSPPYYNAKSYSQWPNVYTYLYDMHNINKEVYRVLKPGGIYLYNIFDYFDNENIVVFSDMGKKRLILGAYIINSFKKLGFEVLGNIIWFKGEVQGKRNFNQGNFSPYYQAPLNSYEHIFVLSKPPIIKFKLPQILAKKPVFKMIKGKNIVGHDAPYPEAIPNLLFEILGNEAKYVLDPFGGTMTTSRAAIKRGIQSVSIEQNFEYCHGGLKNLKKIAQESLKLF